MRCADLTEMDRGCGGGGGGGGEGTVSRSSISLRLPFNRSGIPFPRGERKPREPPHMMSASEVGHGKEYRKADEAREVA